MKKLISILLCVTLMLSTALLFSSCKKGNDWEPVVSKKTVSVDLSDYAIVYGTELSDSGRQDVNNTLTKMKELTALGLRSWPDEETDVVSTEDLEILIGATNRKETVKALKSVKDHGWVIRVFDNKIVIAGTTPFLTRAALSYFADNFVNDDCVKGTTITLNQNVKLSGIETASVLDGESSRYVLVYDDRVDGVDNPASYAYDSDTNPTGGDDVDTIFTIVDQIRNLLTKSTQLRSSAFPTKLDNAETGDFEILVGNMNDRDDYKQAISKLEADEYGISIRDGKIMLLAWNDVTVTAAYNLFEDMVTSFTQTDDAGNSKLELPMNLDIKVNIYNDWVTDFPKPEGDGIALDGTRDVADNCLEYIYSGTGVNNEAYLAYCKKLEDAGFKTIAAENVVEGSTYRTYVNEDSGVFLHVYHSAYTHAAEYGIKNMLPSIRIISSDESLTLPDQSILAPQSYTDLKKGSKVTQLKLNYSGQSFGNSYVVTLADGSFIVYDGGLGKGGNQDLQNIWNVLVALHTEVHGKAPSGEAGNQIHVRAWLLSHEHHDHFVVFTQFVREYGKRPEFKLDRLMYNATSDTQQVNCHNPSAEVRTKMSTLQSYVTGGFDYIKVHTGQVYYFANVKIEVMYTHEDSYPRGLEYFNNSSSIFRMTFTDVNTTMIWLGDSERIGGDNIVATYGATLDADMVQVAHHGWNGVREQTYLAIAAEVIWWPTELGNIKAWAQNPNASKWFWKVDYAVAHTLPNTKMILIADTYNTTMTLTGNESDWRNLKDMAGNKTIEYQNNPSGANGTAAVVDTRPAA